MALENKAAVLFGKMDLRVVPKGPVSEPGMGQVRIKIQRVGICGSDVHYWCHGNCGPYVLRNPMVIGHESAGVVDKVGTGVTNLQEGDSVAIEPGIPCRSCSYCLGGRYNLCPDMKFFATPPVDGSLALYVIHPADFCYKLPENLSLDEGAFCEPLSVGVHACNRAGVSFGKTVLVLGCGPIGLVTIMVAKAYGASYIVATDMLQHRLEMARQCGAHATITLRQSSAEEEMVVKSVVEMLAEISSLFSFADVSDSAHCGPQVTIDCTGFENSLQTAMQTTAPGGRVCVVGMGQDITSLPLIAAAAREIDIVGVFRYANTYPTCIRLMSSGAVDVKPLVTHRFGFDNDEVLAGFEMARSGNAIKVMFSLPEKPSLC